MMSAGMLDFDDDPETLRAALAMIEAWEDGSSSPATTSADESEDLLDLLPDDDDDDDHELGIVPIDNSSTQPTVTSGKNGPSKANISKKQKRVVEEKVFGVKTESLGAADATAQASSALVPKTNKTRNRRREELLYLRGKVNELEELLKQLKQRQPQGGVRIGTTGEEVDRAMTIMWEDIASRQQKQRQSAELQNAKLRVMVETQVKVARDLMRLLKKVRKHEDNELVAPTKRLRLPAEISDKATEVDQRARVDQLFLQTFMVFSATRFCDGTLAFRDIQVNDDAPHQTFIDIHVSWTVPFPVDRVALAMWTTMIKKSEKKIGESDSVEPSCGNNVFQKELDVVDDTIVASFTAQSTNEDFIGAFGGKMVSKKFSAGDNQVVIVGNMLAEPVGEEASSFAGMRLHEDSWMRVIELPSKSETSPILTQVQSSRRLRLQFDVDHSPSHRRRVGALTDFVLSQIKQELTWKQQMTENLLLEARI